MIPKLVQEILHFKPHPSQLEYSGTVKMTSINIVQELQRLFGFMIRSNKKYVDPNRYLNSIVDDFGKMIWISETTDIGEFNMTLVARIEEGLKAKFPVGNESEEFTLKQRLGSLTGMSLTDEGIISQLFYAKQVVILKSKNEDNSDFIVTKASVFGKIPLDLWERDLIHAWDAYSYQKIDEYWIDEFKSSAVKEKWIEKLPGMLLFQIQRITLSSEGYYRYKNFGKFTFPKVIYPDRYLLRNKEISNSRRDILKDLKEKCEELEDAITNFRRYKNGDLGLNVIFEEIGKLLQENQNPSVEQETYDEELTIFAPEFLTFSDEILKEISLNQETFNHLSTDITQKVEAMEAQLEKLKQEIESIYDIDELKKHEYNLHSILVHDGNPGGGYYYAYVFDAEYEI